MPDALFIFCFVRIERKSVFCLNTDLTKQQTETEVVFDSLNQSYVVWDDILQILHSYYGCIIVGNNSNRSTVTHSSEIGVLRST